MVGSAVELLDADTGIVSLVEREGVARIRAVHNLPQEVVGAVVAVGQGLTGQVLSTRDAVIVKHYSRDLPNPFAVAAHVAAAVAVPVWLQGQLVGQWVVESKQPQRRATIRLDARPAQSAQGVETPADS